MYRTNTRNDCEFLFEVLVEKHNVVIRCRLAAGCRTDQGPDFLPPRKNLQGIENKGPNVPFKGEAFSAAFDDIPDRTELTFVFELGGQSAEKTTLLLDE